VGGEELQQFQVVFVELFPVESLGQIQIPKDAISVRIGG
jgi:hypothetical protein